MEAKNKKTKYFIEIRKQEFVDHFATARKKKMLDDEVALPFDHDVFKDRLFYLFKNRPQQGPVSQSLVSLRLMSCGEDFFIEDKMLSSDFAYFINEMIIGTSVGPENLAELTHFLINCFLEENFRAYFANKVMMSLQHLAKSDDPLIISNLMRILLNITNDKEGAKAVVKNFRTEPLMRFLKEKDESPDIELYHLPMIMKNIVSKYDELEYHEVS